MANKDITAEELIQVLKFTPRTYRISMWGYGGEKVMGTVDPRAWDYCLKNRVDLVDLAWGYDYCEDNGLDEEQLPFSPGSWYECDNMGHVNGVSRSAGTLQITDEKGNTVFEKSFDDCDGCEGSPEWCCNDEVWIGSRAKGEVVFVGSSNEKGTFFEGDIELREPFDIEKLELHYEEIDGEEIINSVYYNGEEIENVGGCTDGKSSDMDMVRVTDDEGNWERYVVPEEDQQNDKIKDLAFVLNPLGELERTLKDFEREFGTSDNTEESLREELDNIWLEWDDEDKTAWYPIKIKPVHPGDYECQFKKLPTWPWPAVQTVTWTGKAWLNEDGDAVKGIKEWRGLRKPAP